MRKLSRKLFRNNIRSSKARKALELYLFVKEKYVSSTINNFTYTKLSAATRLSRESLKKRIQTLKEMELVEFVGKNKQHLLFKNARSNKSNVRIDKLDFSSIEALSDGLCALFLVEVQLQKEYVRQLFAKKENAKKGDNIRGINRKIRELGYVDSTFRDCGISYKYLAKKLGIGYNKVSALIKMAEKQDMVVKQKHIDLVYDARKEGTTGFYAFNFVKNKKNKFATLKGIYSVHANSYLLVDGLDWYGTILDY